jgi:hypothetical protein
LNATCPLDVILADIATLTASRANDQELVNLHKIALDIRLEADDQDGAAWHLFCIPRVTVAYGYLPSEDWFRKVLEEKRIKEEQASYARRFARLIGKPVRAAAGLEGKPWPIVIVDGDSEPKLKGCSYHWVNKSGELIRSPNAYRRSWGKPIYVSSDRRIEVGRDWLVANNIPTEV